MAERLATGIEALDRELDGGIPAGSIVVLHAPPASQSELILQEIVEERNSLYISIERQKEDVLKPFADDLVHSNKLVVRNPSLESPLDNARDAVRQITNQANIIVDTTRILETPDDETRYVNFLNELATQLKTTDSIAFLHAVKSPGAPVLRDTTLQMADLVLDLTVDMDGDNIENRLSIPKFRGGAALDENIKLELRDSVEVDTSRDIA